MKGKYVEHGMTSFKDKNNKAEKKEGEWLWF